MPVERCFAVSANVRSQKPQACNLHAISNALSTLASNKSLLDHAFGDLYGIEGRTFEELVAAGEKIDRVRIAYIIANLSDEHIESTGRLVRHREVIALAVVH